MFFVLTFRKIYHIIKGMNILWIADFSLRHNAGGAQRSDNILIEAGRDMGLSITEFNYDTHPSVIGRQYDAIVSANLEQMSRSHVGLFEFICSHPRHFRVEHDANRYLHSEARKNLFGSCRKCFFLTQFHLDQFIESYGDIFSNPLIVPDPIDTSLFYNQNSPREDATVYTGFMHELKGTHLFIEHATDNPERSFHCAVWGDPAFESALKELENVNFRGELDFNSMPNFYNSYKTMFYKPVFYEPFCRSVAEAVFCGMEIESNDKIGCLHELERLGEEEFRIRCSNAPNMLWGEINVSI